MKDPAGRACRALHWHKTALDLEVNHRAGRQLPQRDGLQRGGEGAERKDGSERVPAGEAQQDLPVHPSADGRGPAAGDRGGQDLGQGG